MRMAGFAKSATTVSVSHTPNKSSLSQHDFLKAHRGRLGGVGVELRVESVRPPAHTRLTL